MDHLPRDAVSNSTDSIGGPLDDNPRAIWSLLATSRLPYGPLNSAMAQSHCDVSFIQLPLNPPACWKLRVPLACQLCIVSDKLLTLTVNSKRSSLKVQCQRMKDLWFIADAPLLLISNSVIVSHVVSQQYVKKSKSPIRVLHGVWLDGPISTESKGEISRRVKYGWP